MRRCGAVEVVMVGSDFTCTLRAGHDGDHCDGRHPHSWPRRPGEPSPREQQLWDVLQQVYALARDDDEPLRDPKDALIVVSIIVNALKIRSELAIVNARKIREVELMLLAALKTLRDAVVRHGITEGEGEAWLSAFQGLMTAVRAADAAIAKAEGR